MTGCSLEARCRSQAENRFVGDSTVDFRYPQWHNELLDTRQGFRLFGLGQGVAEIHLPDGFGLPMKSNEPLWWTFRVVNLEAYQADTEVRFHGRLDFIRQRGLQEPITALTARVLSPSREGWPVPPGGQIHEADVTDQLGLTESTRLHFASVALHPRAHYSELRDQTTGEVLLRLEMQERRPDSSLKSVETYSSQEGVLLNASHRFELVTYYENPSQAPIRGVAFWMVYLADPDFRPDP